MDKYPLTWIFTTTMKALPKIDYNNYPLESVSNVD